MALHHQPFLTMPLAEEKLVADTYAQLLLSTQITG
jgi:hypothetical protein